MYECVVVGAGIEGSATAYNLVKRETSEVLLLEQVTLSNRYAVHLDSPSLVPRPFYAQNTRMRLRKRRIWPRLECEKRC